MKIAIVDDMEEDSIRLRVLISQYAQAHSMAVEQSVYSSGEAFLKDGKPLEVDVVFLDIYMGILSGMEVATRLRAAGATCPIVFLTTSQVHAVESYQVRAFDYLLKPITYEKLERTLGILRSKQSKEEPFLVVKEGRGPRKIVLDEIDYVDYYNHYIQIHMGQQVVRSYQKFSAFEEQVKKYTMFLTCHRCVMVNMRRVEKIDDGFFLMKSGKYVPINRKWIKEIKANYFNYVFGEFEGTAHE